MARSSRLRSTVLPLVLTVVALTATSLGWSASRTTRTEAAEPVSLQFRYANLPAKAGGEIVFSKGVEAIATQTALSSSPGTIKAFIAHQRGFTITAADNAPLDADITLSPQPSFGTTAITGRATVPEGATLTLRVGNRAPESIANGKFTIELPILARHEKAPRRGGR
jgi:hypothetical protein